MMRPQRNVARTFNVSVPNGLNLADPPSAIGAGDCLQLNNLTRGESGLRPRLGTIEHCTGLGAEVRTMLPFQASATASDKLFACTSTGIFDVTVSTSGPELVHEFSVQTGSAGYGVGFVFQTAADRFLVYCDEANGYLLYRESTGTWAAVAAGSGAGEIDGVDPATFAFAVPWKNRIWFVQRDSSAAWYLPLSSVTGTAAKWEFGNRLKGGGTLVGLWNWTLDGGAGIDDLLVGIMSSGDALIYQGTDPSAVATFALRGVWSVGAVPAGRRICTDQGGDLLVLTSLGILPLSQLVGAGEKLDANLYTTRKIQPLLARYMDARRSSLGWAMVLSPEDGVLLVILPQASGQTDEQLAMSTSTKGWSRYRGLDITSACAWDGKLYCGTSDGRIIKNTGRADGVLLDGSGATPISFSLLTGFSDFGVPGYKRATLARPSWTCDGTEPSYGCEARYDFDLGELSESLQYVPTATGWDVGLWDVMTWDGAATSSALIGLAGMGRHVAVGLTGQASSLVTLTGVEVSVDFGGVL